MSNALVYKHVTWKITIIFDIEKQLKNIGPKLASKMIEAGIDTPEKLRTMGARKAFVAMYPDGDAYGDYNAAYIYALEGAIRNCAWSDLPEAIKREHKEYAEQLQKKSRENEK